MRATAHRSPTTLPDAEPQRRADASSLESAADAGGRAAALAPRRDLLLLIVASLLATIPVWIPTFPPMTDLPQHASQIALLRAMQDPAFPYASSFYINWFTPYLLGYLLVYGLASVVDIVVACKLVVSAALAALPLSTALVMRETGTDRRWALLSIPAMYSFSYHWGFLNFLVAAPLGLVFVWLTLRQARQATVGGAFALGVTINALFFCHAMICVFFGLVGGLILLLSGRSFWSAILRPLPLASVVPMAILWGTRTMATNALARRATLWDLNWVTTVDGYYSTLAQGMLSGGFGWGRTAGIFPRLLGTMPGLLPTIVGLAIFLLPLAAGARFTRRRMIWVPFIVCLATLLFVPGILFGTDFTFQRFSVFLLPLFLITLERPAGRAWPRWTWSACTALAAAWIGVVSMNAVQYESEAAGFDEILTRMEPGQRVLSFAFERDSLGTIAPPFLHFPSWYSAVKGGVVDPNIAGTHVQLVLYRAGHQPRYARLWGFEWFPATFHWPSFNGGQYRYFVAKAPHDPGPFMFRHATCPVRRVHHVNHWWLYEIVPGCAAPGPSRS